MHKGACMGSAGSGRVMRSRAGTVRFRFPVCSTLQSTELYMCRYLNKARSSMKLHACCIYIIQGCASKNPERTGPVCTTLYIPVLPIAGYACKYWLDGMQFDYCFCSGDRHHVCMHDVSR